MRFVDIIKKIELCKEGNGIYADSSQTQITKAMKEMKSDKDISKVFYQKAMDLAKAVLEKAAKDEPFDIEEVYTLVEGTIDQVVLGGREFLALIDECEASENYLFVHCPNVAILAIYVGLALGYNKSKLDELGVAAYFHDIGMTRVTDIVAHPNILSDEEYEKVKMHPQIGSEILKIQGASERLIRIVREEHERMDGSGYPFGIGGGDINEYARIIGLVDTYEAMTHQRPYRKKLDPHEASKEILTSGQDLFEISMIRTLINIVDVYPIGSWVELNTGEIAKVIEVNKDHPLKPVVNIMFDSQNNVLKDTATINLVKSQNRYIKRPLLDEELKEKIKQEI